MPKIHLTSFIQAPAERVFNLSRHLAIRKLALQKGREQILSSSSDSLVQKGETITLRARHLGRTREITARIVDISQPDWFTEEQVKGDLKSYRHECHFKPAENGTILIDMLEYEGPRDLLGSIISAFFLRSYFESMLRKKNDLVRQYAETEKWKAVLS
jgi:ligand-binding SRPBCC domain-containing protein